MYAFDLINLQWQTCIISTTSHTQSATLEPLTVKWDHRTLPASSF